MSSNDLADLFAVADHLGWMRWSSCGETDPDLFHPEDSNAAQAEQAKSVCRRCPVRDECLDYALGNREEFGVWGGLSPVERRRLQLGAVA
ncbi:WhiB family transcriptional regulator [Sphaerisporangium sp. TRM90804]|uniref:WhiB family transcriptional regulator n=1 Tax=Sphaerisporangium sp. TRM90804 TaxID=3031113 RepID=UPI002449724E|nr:WhiB family transcriptional regulator [Sphaerisporangium sp. TRM90804]MDH2424715.1 WhiB family transcriptional regulator [Sphaerisporangium sp. TRM90804]